MIRLNEKTVMEAIQNNDIQSIEKLVLEAIQNDTFSTTEKKRVTAFKTLSKKYNKQFKDTRPQLAGAFLNKEGYFSICNGYSVIVLNKSKVENCVMKPEDASSLNIDDFFHSIPKEELTIDVNNVLYFLKTEKAKKNKEKIIYKMNEIWFDAEIFKNINECLDLNSEKTEINYTNDVNPIYFQNKNGKALLMPVRKTEQ